MNIGNQRHIAFGRTHFFGNLAQRLSRFLIWRGDADNFAANLCKEVFGVDLKPKN